MNKLVKRLLTGTLAFATILTALPVTAVHASGNQYWTESAERVGYIEHVMNDGSIKSTFNEGHMKVEGETAYCVDINTSFKNGYKTRSDASTRMNSDQIADVALSLEYVKQYTASHTNLNYKQGYLLEQCVVWQRLSEQLGWQCDNVRASYNEISQAVQNEVYAGAKAFVKANKGRYECGGYIYTGEGQDIGQFWAKLNVGNAKVKKTSSNPTITDGNANYSFEGATFGVYSDKGCNSQLATLTADGNGDTKEVEVKAGTIYIKELSAKVKRKVWSVDTFREAIQQSDDDLLTICMHLAFSCSMRIGEITGLTWEDVVIDEQSIATNNARVIINKELSRVNAQAMQKLKEKDIIKIFPTQKPHCTTRLVLKTPKTETSNRTVWLPKTVAELLVQYQKDQKELQEFLGDAYNNYNLVIALENGNPVESRIVRDRFQKLCEQNGYEKVVFHSLRHLSTGYKLKMTNGDVKSVQGDTGHAEAEMVTDVYSEIIDEDRRYNAQKMDEQFYSTLNHDSEMQPQNEEVQPENNGLSDSDMELLSLLKSLTPEMKEMLLKQSASK